MIEWRDALIGKDLLYSLAAVIIICYFIPMDINAFTFHFKHANIFHLFVNAMALTSVLYRCKLYTLPIAFILTSVIWQASWNVIGFSGIIFFMWGTRFFYDIHNTPNKWRHIALSSIPFVVSAIIPRLSIELHLYPFLIGSVFGLGDYVHTRYMKKI